MKVVIQFLVVCLIVMMTSCTVTENIYVNADGSGKFSVDLDGSGLMAMMPKDSVSTNKNIDSTFTFKQLLAENKDSIAKLSSEEKQMLKKLENFNMSMKMNQDTKTFLFVLHTDFKNVSELQDAMQAINAISMLQGKANKTMDLGSAFPAEGLTNNKSTLTYSFKGNKFTRNAVLNKVIKETQNDEMAEMNKMVFASSNYVIKYHFSKPIKKVTNPTALFSDDRKTVTIQYPFSDYMENPEKLNFEIEF